MRVIYRALKPGGVMVCEEAGVSAIYAETRSAAYEEMRDIALRAGRDRGVDYDGGCRAHLWAKEAGFEIAHVAAYIPTTSTDRTKNFGTGHCAMLRCDWSRKEAYPKIAGKNWWMA